MAAVKELTTEELQTLIKITVAEAMQEWMEDLQALNNPTYLASIEAARDDYRAGRVKSFEEVFGV
jgi:hypothetical protein